jgi:hypothetical protein
VRGETEKTDKEGGMREIMRKRFAAAALFAMAAVPSIATEAHAYLDPGTGSILLQLLLGGFAGLLVIIKMYWKNISSALPISKKKPQDK